MKNLGLACCLSVAAVGVCSAADPAIVPPEIGAAGGLVRDRQLYTCIQSKQNSTPYQGGETTQDKERKELQCLSDFGYLLRENPLSCGGKQPRCGRSEEPFCLPTPVFARTGWSLQGRWACRGINAVFNDPPKCKGVQPKCLSGNAVCRSGLWECGNAGGCSAAARPACDNTKEAVCEYWTSSDGRSSGQQWVCRARVVVERQPTYKLKP